MDGHVSGEAALAEIKKHVARMDELQALLYANRNQSLPVVLQEIVRKHHAAAQYKPSTATHKAKPRD